MEARMARLREHMRTHPATSAPRDESVVSFRRDAPNSPEDEGMAALNLVDQAADVIKGIQHRAAQTEAYARSLVDRALDKLELAERHIKSLEAERQTIETTLSKITARIDELEDALQRAESR